MTRRHDGHAAEVGQLTRDGGVPADSAREAAVCDVLVRRVGRRRVHFVFFCVLVLEKVDGFGDVVKRILSVSRTEVDCCVTSGASGVPSRPACAVGSLRLGQLVRLDDAGLV